MHFLSDLCANSKTPIKLLDLGCGNGRFLTYLKQQQLNVNYTGVDNNEAFLTEALTKNPEATFIKLDIFKKLASLNQKFNFIVIFGVMHHIPDTNFRKNWLTQVISMLEPSGILVLTLWDFATEKILEKLPGEGDYLLGWDKKPGLVRYAHKFSKDEISSFMNNATLLPSAQGLRNEQSYLSRSSSTNNDVELLETYEADGKNNKTNKYLIFKKLSQ